MKPNENHPSRSSALSARLQLGIVLMALLLCLPAGLAQSVPGLINYQGILLKGDGTPVPAVSTPVEFRIYDELEGGTLQWSRIHNITPDTNGAFSVVLMDGGSPITGETPRYTTLAPVFTSGTQERYLELRVPPSTAIKPRQRFVAAPYAFLAQNVAEAKQNFTVTGTLTVSSAASVGSLTASGAASVGSLTASGAANVGSLTVGGVAGVQSLIVTNAVTAASFSGNGAGLTNLDASKITSGILDEARIPLTFTNNNRTLNANKVGIGTSTTPANNLEVKGTVKMFGTPTKYVPYPWVPDVLNGDNAYKTGGPYETDGFLSVTSHAGASPNSPLLFGYLEGSIDFDGTTYVLGGATLVNTRVDYGNPRCSFMMPVPKGYTWKVTFNLIVRNSYYYPTNYIVWTPLGQSQ